MEVRGGDRALAGVWGRSPRKILTKMIHAFDAFSRNLEAEPLQRSGGRAAVPENFDKNECF